MVSPRSNAADAGRLSPIQMTLLMEVGFHYLHDAEFCRVSSRNCELPKSGSDGFVQVCAYECAYVNGVGFNLVLCDDPVLFTPDRPQCHHALLISGQHPLRITT